MYWMSRETLQEDSAQLNLVSLLRHGERRKGGVIHGVCPHLDQSPFLQLPQFIGCHHQVSGTPQGRRARPVSQFLKDVSLFCRRQRVQQLTE
jgi:hypothetical protein